MTIAPHAGAKIGRGASAQDNDSLFERPKFPASADWDDGPRNLPRRLWLYGRHRLLGSVSATIGDGGKGKSSLVIAEAVAMATGRNLLGVQPNGRTPVLYWSGDECTEEVMRRVYAVCQHYGIDHKDLTGKLFTSSSFDREITVARAAHSGITFDGSNVMAEIDEFVHEHGIEALILDPFVACHQVDENDNAEINAAVRQWSRLAAARVIAVELVHHTRKPPQGGASENSVADARGASSFIDAVRSARVFNAMTESEARQARVEDRSKYFRVTNGKANYAPASAEADWFQFVSVTLPNVWFAEEPGDSVGVVTPWRFPQPFDNVTTAHMHKVREMALAGQYRADVQSPDWIGRAVAEVLDLDAENDKTRIKSLLKAWFANGALRVVKRKDDERKLRSFVEPGEWSSP